MKPDDDHVCQPMFDDSGELLAVVHGSPDMSDAVRKAIANMLEAARRLAEDDADLLIRQAESRRRIRERNARLRDACGGS